MTHIKSALYSPQANASERSNGEFLVKLRILLTEKQDNWDIHVSKITSILLYFCAFGYNMILHVCILVLAHEVGQEFFFRKMFQQSDFKRWVNSKVLPSYSKCWLRKLVGSSCYELETLNGQYIGLHHAKDIKPF